MGVMRWMLAGLLLPSLAWAQEPRDLSGRYQGTLSLHRPDGSLGPQVPFSLILRYENGTPACTGNTGSFADQLPCSNVRIANGRIAFTLPLGGGVQFDLAASNGILTGTVAALPGDPAPPVNTAEVRRTGDLELTDRFAPLEWEGQYRSPVILNLRRRLAEGENGAVADFWDRIQASGSPILEPSSDRSTLATFLWRDSGQKNVLLLWPLSTARLDDYFFSRIPGTDIWFKTLKLRTNTRAYYQIAPDDPFGTRPTGSGEHHAQADPLNPKHESSDPNISLSRTRSLLELPGAPEQPWYAKGSAPKYTLVEKHIQSRFLKGDRRVKVYLPPGYSTKHAPYPSLYLTDGEDPDGLVFATWTFENLLAAKKIPPMVIVRILNPDQEVRRRELSFNDDFGRYLTEELAPMIRKEFHTSATPSRTGIGGYSLGGLAAAYTALRHPNAFGLVLSQSGSFGYEPSGKEFAEPNWMAGEFARTKKLPVRFYMDAGTDELDMSGQGAAILIPNRQLRDVLRAKGYEVHYQEFAGGHEYINWRGTLADGVIALFGKS